MRIKIARYALLDILKELKQSGINEIAITKEDGNLIIVIPDKILIPKTVNQFPTYIEAIPKYIDGANYQGENS